MDFYDCVMECAKKDDLVSEFNRLTGRRLGDKQVRNPIDRIIDEAIGYDEVLKAQQDEDVKAFVDFCYEYVWLPILGNPREPVSP